MYGHLTSHKVDEGTGQRNLGFVTNSDFLSLFLRTSMS